MLSIDEVKNDVFKIMSELLEKDVEEIKLQGGCDLIEDYDFDSILIIKFLSELENHYSMKISAEDMMECISDINVLFDLILRKK